MKSKILVHCPFAIVVLYAADLILTGKPLKESILTQQEQNWIMLSVMVACYLLGYTICLIQRITDKE